MTLCVDASSVQGTAGEQRRSGVRRRKFRSIEQKRQMVQETLEPGASVAVIARRHGSYFFSAENAQTG
jgi:hypothetical protein